MMNPYINILFFSPLLFISLYVLVLVNKDENLKREIGIITPLLMIPYIVVLCFFMFCPFFLGGM